MIPVTVYTRAGCHLCDEMKAVVYRVARSLPLAIDEVDVDTDAALAARYGEEVPVLMVAGRKAAKYRITEDALRRVLLSTP